MSTWAELTAARWAICQRCPVNMLRRWRFGLWRCLACGCFMALKTRVPIAHCPYGYW